jgi:signal transduction histidine kinase
MNAQILADEMAKAGKPDESLRRIIREADRMELYLGELMDLAKAEPAAPAGAPPPPRRRTLRLDELGEAVAGLLEGRSRHAGVEIRRLWDPHTPAVFADETQMHQVILNLVLNALDATRPGGTVTLKTLKARDGSARLEVRDTGAGVKVPPGADVFEPFVTTKASGIGLGLYVCRRNVEGHGGRIGYDSSGAGSTFWIELPPAGP